MPEVSMRVQEDPVLILNGSLSSMAEPQQIYVASPRIVIEEQPASVFRFRYESEHGSHGSLMGETSNKGRKTCPRIRIEDYVGRVRLRVSLYTYKDEDTTDPGSPGTPVQHVHMLHGKNCDKERGVCEVEVDVPLDGKSVEFPNLYISHVAKRNIPSILHARYLQEHEHNVLTLAKLGWGQEVCIIYEETNLKLKQRAESDAKNMEKKLNSVILCFEAEAFVQNTWVKCCEPIYSTPINNQKAAATGSLKICRIDRTAGSIKGGDQVFILCEKVDKKNIKVRFYQDNDNWEDFGIFNEFDVHHQYAIVFKTPKYKDTSLGEDVQVKIELYRPTDGAVSNSVDYIYTPEDDYDLRRKKRKKIENSSMGFGDTKPSSCSQEPGTSFKDKKPSNLQLCPAQSYGSSAGTSAAETMQEPNTSDILNEVLTLEQNPFLQMPASIPDATRQTAAASLFTVSDPMIGQTFQGFQDLLAEFESPDQLRFPTESMDISLANLNDLSHNTIGFESLLVNDSPEDGLTFQNSNDSDLISRGSVSFDDDDDLVPDGPGSTIPNSGARTVKTEQRAGHVGRPTAALATKLGQNGKNVNDTELVYRLALQTAKKLRDYARSSDIQHLLTTMRHLTAVPDDNGDNAIHLAAIHSQPEAILQMAKVADTDPINAFNELIQTPLHIAVHVNNPDIVKSLIQNGADVNLLDRYGDSALHIAAKHGKPEVVQIIVNKENYCKKQVGKFAIVDVLNYNGYAPLHLAVLANSLECVKQLCLAGCNVNIQDGTSGRTALHLAVENKHEEILKFLLTQESINIDSQSFNGYTSLHLAVSMKQESLVKLLMSGDADPFIENCEPVLEQLSSDEETNTPDASAAKPDLNESEESNRCCNSFDIAKDNDQMLQLLNEVKAAVKTCPPNTTIPEQLSDSGLSIDEGFISDKIISKDSEYLENLRTPHDLFDEHTKNHLARLLDGSGKKNWKTLSQILQLEHLDGIFETSKSPTLVMLQYIDSVPELYNGLVTMAHKEAVSLIQNFCSESDDGEQRQTASGMTTIPQELAKQMAQLEIKP